MLPLSNHEDRKQTRKGNLAADQLRGEKTDGIDAFMTAWLFHFSNRPSSHMISDVPLSRSRYWSLATPSSRSRTNTRSQPRSKCAATASIIASSTSARFVPVGSEHTGSSCSSRRIASPAALQSPRAEKCIAGAIDVTTASGTNASKPLPLMLVYRWSFILYLFIHNFLLTCILCVIGVSG